jgi:hypothetical protein
MPSQGDYRLLAQYYLTLAKACTEPSNADRYRAITADYFDRAVQGGTEVPVAQQQQQIQPGGEFRLASMARRAH